MRRELGQEVARQLDVRMSRSLPQFRRVKPERGTGALRQYRWDSSTSVAFFLSLLTHRIWDSFTLELAWSKAGRYPGSVPPDDPSTADEVAEELRFRIGKLWAPPPADVWWELGPGPFETKEQLLRKVSPAVDDAVDKMASYGLSYVTRLVTRG